MGTTPNMPPIFRLRAFLAARAELCEQCRKAPKVDKFEGHCSQECLEKAVAYQSY